MVYVHVDLRDCIGSLVKILTVALPAITRLLQNNPKIIL